MRERAKDGSNDKQGEDDNGGKIRKDDDRIAATSQRSIGDPDCSQGVRCGKGVADSGILILGTEPVSPLLEPTSFPLRAYNLGNSIHCRLTLLIVSLEPENESCKGLTPERLHHCQ